MDIITSVNNETIKETAKLLQKKYRIKTNKFLIEGLKPVEEAINSKIEVEQIFINEKSKNLFEKFNKHKIIATNEIVLKKISSTETPPDIVAIANQKNYNIKSIKNLNKIILLENIKDAGNLGTIIRTAKALNFDAIILYGETVDLYNPKTVRSAVGNLWKLPIIHINDFTTLNDNFKNYEKVATLPNANYKLNDYKPNYPLLLMFGSEADGLSEELKTFSNQSLTIEMNKEVESLNLSISAAIIMYKISSIQMI